MEQHADRVTLTPYPRPHPSPNRNPNPNPNQEIVVVLSEAEWQAQLQADIFKRRRGPGAKAGAPYWQLANEKHRRAARAPGPLGRLFGFS